MTDTLTTASNRYADGLPILQTLAGGESIAILDNLADIAPDLGRYLVEFGYGDIYARGGLTLRERQLATIAALAALGNAPGQMKFHVNGALNAGATRQEIVETIIHISFYAGFPAALNALLVAKEVFATRPDGIETSGDKRVQNTG
jgi:4-carboxymuconolactone decarboxylase